MGIVVLILTLAAKLLFDSYLHFSKKVIKHKGEAVAVFILLTGAAYLSAHGFNIRIPIYLVCFLSIMWASFDSAFGLIIARDPFFLGSTSALDKLQTKYPVIQIGKYVLAVLAIALLITGKINKL